MGKNTFNIIYEGKVVGSTSINVQLPPRSVDENAKKTNFVHVNEEGTELKQIKHEFISVGESIAQVKYNTCAKVTEYGSIKVVQFKSEVSSRGEEVWYYKNSTATFEGTLADAKTAFPDVNFEELNPPNTQYTNDPELGWIPVSPNAQPVQWTTQNEYDAEKEGGPTTWDKYLNATQTALDVIGLIPGIGEFADLANGVISLARGNYKEAGLSFAAMIPGAGMFAGIGKLAAKASKKANKIEGVYDFMVKNGDDIKAYVGQSNDVLNRIKRHFSKSGKFNHGTFVGPETIYKMPGSTKKQREIYEQWVIYRKYRGDIATLDKRRKKIFTKLLNKVNPTGGRYPFGKDGLPSEEYMEKLDEVLKRWNHLPKDFN